MLFHSNDLTYCGVPVSVFDYAHFHETMGCGISYVSYWAGHKDEARQKFETRFPGRVHPLVRERLTAEVDALVE